MITKLGADLCAKLAEMTKVGVSVGYLHSPYQSVEIRVQDGGNGKHKEPHVHVRLRNNTEYVFFYAKPETTPEAARWKLDKDGGRASALPDKKLREEVYAFCRNHTNKEIMLEMHKQFTANSYAGGNKNLTY